MTTKQISKNQSENKSLNCFCYTQNIFHKSIVATVVIVNFDTYESLFLSVNILLQVCSLFVRSIVYVQRSSLLKHGAKRRKTHLYHFSKGPTWKTPFSIMFNLMYSGKNFGLCPTPPPPPHILTEYTIAQLWGQQRTQKGKQGI